MNQSQCKNLFLYLDGGLYWIRDRGNNAKAGNRAGRILPTGYRSIHISGRRYQEHRLIFLWHNGYTPSQIDHINGDKSDNRIENLRIANHSQNQMNTKTRESSSMIRGVFLVKKTGRWAARIYNDGKEVRIGTFASSFEAKEAYDKFAIEMYGEFVRKEI